MTKDFQPDWDMLEATRESLREHMVMVATLTAERDAAIASAIVANDRADLYKRALDVMSQEIARADKLIKGLTLTDEYHDT